jgi:uncharacterized protein (DUF2147 family)
MKTLTGSLLLSSLTLLMSIFSITAHSQVSVKDIEGIWLNEDKDAHVQIEMNENKFFGKIVWLKEPLDDETGKPKLDKKNPDENLKKRPIMGLELLSDFEFDGENEWENGKIYDPKSGKTYSCYMTFSDKSKNNLKVRGYIGLSLIGRTTIWTRVE